MKLKGIELNGFYEIECTDTYLNIYDEKGKRIYFEDSVGYWAKWEYDEYGNQVYYENSDRNKHKIEALWYAPVINDEVMIVTIGSRGRGKTYSENKCGGKQHGR